MLDDYQDCGTRPIDVKAMNLDFFVTGTLKYLLGPPGLAFMYVRKELISSLVPTITGWFAQTNPFAFDPKVIDLSPTARRFESGSPSVPNVYAAVPGFQLLQEIGMENVATTSGNSRNLCSSLRANSGFAPRRPRTAWVRWWCCNRRIQTYWCRNLPTATSWHRIATTACA